MQDLKAYTNTMPIIIPYCTNLPNTLGLCPKPKICRRSIRIEHGKPSTFVIQSQLTNTSPESSESFITSSDSSPLGWKNLFGSQLLLVRHSLSQYNGSFSRTPPPPLRQLCSLFFYLCHIRSTKL